MRLLPPTDDNPNLMRVCDLQTGRVAIKLDIGVRKLKHTKTSVPKQLGRVVRRASPTSPKRPAGTARRAR
jgi:hypothetical protein